VTKTREQLEDMIDELLEKEAALRDICKTYQQQIEEAKEVVLRIKKELNRDDVPDHVVLGTIQDELEELNKALAPEDYIKED
jgi:predicted transcriptional regulator